MTTINAATTDAECLAAFERNPNPAVRMAAFNELYKRGLTYSPERVRENAKTRKRLETERMGRVA